MIAKEFASYARTGGESLRISDVTVEAGCQTRQLDGKLQILDGYFVIELNVPAGVMLPGVDGYGTSQNSWRLRGWIEENVVFSCTSILESWNPFPEIAGSARFLATSLIISDDISEQPNDRTQGVAPNEDLSSFRCFAILPDFQLLGANCSTHVTKLNDFLGESRSHRTDTLKGDAGAWEFGLIPCERDLAVHLRYKKGFPANEQTARRAFWGLLSAISFTHGVQVWPQHFQLWHGNRKLEEIVTPARKFLKTNHPFLFQRHCVVATDLVCALTKVALFLSQDNAFTKEIERLMFLARLSGTEDTPIDVGTLSLCAVFEGLVDQTFDFFQLGNALLDKDKELKEFAQAKTKLVEYTSKLEGFSPATIERLQGGLAWMNPIRLKDKFRAVVDQFGLPWDGVMGIALKVWDEERGRLAHGARVRSECDEDLRASWRNQSRLGCAINILFAKLCGYGGVAMYSTVEEKTDIRI